jgi:hypothetical protein
MLKTFLKPPMEAFRQPPNLKSMLCRAKLPSKQKQKRILLRMKPCQNPCNTCPYVLTIHKAKSSQTKRNWNSIPHNLWKMQKKTIYWPNRQKTERGLVITFITFVKRKRSQVYITPHQVTHIGIWKCKCWRK